MQSLLQYRRFCAAVQQQIKRDQERAKDLQHTTEKPANQGSEDSDATLAHDAERGNAGHNHRPPGVHAGELDTRIDQSVPMEEEETMRENQHPHSPPLEHEELPSDRSSKAEAEEEGEEEDEDPDLAAMSRWSTTRTHHSMGTALGTALSGIDVRARRTHEGGSGSVFVVNWSGPNDPLNPHNWTRARRFGITFMVASIGAVVGIASSITSSAILEASQEFHVSEVTESLATGLFLVGFGLGSLFAGPISETVGRNPVYLITLVIYMIFIMASALSPNIGAQLAFRFIAGCFASTPLTCAGGSLSDIWSPMERTFAFPVFANAAFSGPLLGPVIGGYIAQSTIISWRWVEWITLIISGLITILVFFFQPETYPPVLLKWKAQHLRELTGDDRYRAEIEIREESFWHRLKRALYRPFLLTFREPIIILIALYLSVVYIGKSKASTSNKGSVLTRSQSSSAS
jgi:multidrug resistance protein